MCVCRKKYLDFLFLNKLTIKEGKGTLPQNTLPAVEAMHPKIYLGSVWTRWPTVPFQPHFSLQDRRNPHKTVSKHTFPPCFHQMTLNLSPEKGQEPQPASGCAFIPIPSHRAASVSLLGGALRAQLKPRGSVGKAETQEGLRGLWDAWERGSLPTGCG